MTGPVPALARDTKHPNRHPLLLLFHSKKFTEEDGLNWLQDRGHISDHCITLADVAPCDVDRILILARAEWAKSKLPATLPS